MSRPASSLDVSRLPTYAHGAKNPLWWGTQSFMLIEGLGFIFAIATYFYLFNENQNWPLAAAPPGLIWSSLLAGLLVLSEIPNVWVKNAAKKKDVEKVRIGLVVMSAIGAVGIVLRCFEFTTMNTRWDDNAYGSITWFLLGLHTAHLLTDLGETMVMTVSMFIGPVDMRRFPEVEDNQDYWHFVVVSWLVIYGILYWFPRWFGVPA
jgi:cytochrome c oxidase subunit 3